MNFIQNICIAIVLAFSFHGISLAQSDSINTGNFITKPLKEKKSFTYGLNNRRSFLFENASTIYGGYMGIQYGKKLKHVVSLNSNLFWSQLDAETSTLEGQLTYIGLAEEYQLYRYKRLAFYSYIQLGLGISRYRPILNPQRDLHWREWVAPAEFGIHASFDVLDWFALKTGGGYLFVWLSEHSEMNGPYYKVAVGVDFEKLLTKYKERKK